MMKKKKEITRFTDISHEEVTSVHSDASAYQSAMKERIEQMHKNRQTLHNNNCVPKKSDDECYQEIRSACKKFVNTPIAENESFLADTMEKYNMQLYCYPCSEISDDKGRVARIAFNGYVDLPADNQLSGLFKNLRTFSYKNPETKPEDYNLNDWPAWQVWKQIPELAALEDQLRKGLSYMRIPPQALTGMEYPKGSGEMKILTLNDLCKVLHERMRPPKGMKAKILEESYKEKYTKRFIKENEKEFRAGLLAMEGVREDYVEALIAAMKNGRTDLTKPPGYKDEWADQPVVDVHHIINIKDCANIKDEGKNWTNVNDYENMCFIVRHPSHDAMHLVEKMMQEIDDLGNYVPENKNKEKVFTNEQTSRKFVYRVQPPDGARCIIGFDTVIYDRHALGMDENTQTNLPGATKEGQLKVKETSTKSSHKHKYYVKNFNLNQRREGKKIARDTINGNRIRA